MFLNENVVALITPYFKGEIDYKSIERYIKHIEESTLYTAILVLGSTGDQHAISIKDKIEIYKFVNKIKTSLKIIYGVSGTNTLNAIKLIECLEELNAENIMLGIPPYILPNQEEIISYVEIIAKKTKADILLYNNYLRTGVNINIETLNYLLNSCSNIKGIKEAGLNKDLNAINTNYIYTGSDLSIVNGDYYSCTSVVGNILPFSSSVFSKKIEKNVKEEIVNEYISILNNLISLGLGKSIRHYLYYNKVIKSNETMLPMLPLNDDGIKEMELLNNRIIELEKKVKHFYF